MKKLIFSALSLLFTVFVFVSCDDTYDDLMTADVKTGGFINPTGSIPYKLGSTPSVKVTIDIPKGPGIDAIEVYRTYTDKTEVLDQTISVASANATADVTKTVTYTYAQLTAGLSMPADEGALEIGDKWTLTYKSIMAADKRVVDNANTTVVAVANFFAGAYVKNMIYHHPAYGVYPDDIYVDETTNVDLVAKNAYECDDWFGSWEDNTVTIHIDPADNYKLTLTSDRSDAAFGNPYNAADKSTYNPVTGVIHLYYYYMGASGARFFDITYTPK